MATGSEVSLIVEAGEALAEQGKSVRLVSFPSWELFKQQSQEYRDEVLPPKIRARLSVEAGVAMGWERWVGSEGASISVDQYGASAPYEKIFEEYGLTSEAVIEKALELIG